MLKKNKIFFFFCLLLSPVLGKAEDYTAIKISSDVLTEKQFKINDGKFIPLYKVVESTSNFISLKDFELYEHTQSGGYWSQQEFLLKSFIPSQIQNYENVGFGTLHFWMYGGWNYHDGDLVLGKSLSQETIEKIHDLSLLNFEGFTIDNVSSVGLSLTVHPQTGMIQGSIGDYLFESNQKIFDGKFEADIYTFLSDNTKKIAGRILLNIYGDEELEMAGGAVIWEENGAKNSHLIFLKRID